MALVLEYESICKAPAQRIVAGLRESEVEVIMSALCAVAEPVRSRFLWRPQLRDPAVSEEDGTSINQFVATAVAEKITAMRTAEFFVARSGEADIRAARRLLRRSGGEPPEAADRLGEGEAGGR